MKTTKNLKKYSFLNFVILLRVTHILGFPRGGAMVQVVSQRPLTAEAWVRSKVRPCVIFYGKIGTGEVFPVGISVFTCVASFDQSSILIH